MPNTRQDEKRADIHLNPAAHGNPAAFIQEFEAGVKARMERFRAQMDQGGKRREGRIPELRFDVSHQTPRGG